MRAKRYTVRTLYNLWIKWLDEEGVNGQELFRKMKLNGSFVRWLERKERAEKILANAIEEHKEGKCRCCFSSSYDFSKGGRGLCYAGQYLKGLITVDQVLGDRVG